MKTLILLLFVTTLQTCIYNTTPLNSSEAVWVPEFKVQEGMKKAYFASGFFWCVLNVCGGYLGIISAIKDINY